MGQNLIASDDGTSEDPQASNKEPMLDFNNNTLELELGDVFDVGFSTSDEDGEEVTIRNVVTSSSKTSITNSISDINSSKIIKYSTKSK